MTAAVPAVLSVRHLEKSFGGVHAVRDVGFDLAAGELLAMIGPNGAGKTTCFNTLNGQLAPDSGTIELAGRSIVGLRPRAIWRLGVGRTFQITQTFGSMTVRENVQMALISHRNRLNSLFARASDLFRDEALALLDQVGIAEQAERPCGVLAYGDLKRVELAVALANEPKLLLMDEPTAGMAPKERVALMALTARIARRRNVAVLFTEHDMDVVFAQADRIIVLDRGRLIAEGPPEAVRADPRVRAVYLGSGAVYGGSAGTATAAKKATA
jgi:branched-chain amino acid transport system ATP-binding protein